MIPRQAQDSARRLPALAGLALVTVLLAGCSSAFLDADLGAGLEPVPTESATPGPEPTAEPEPEPDFDCGDILLNRPGNYVLGECGTVTLEGAGIDLAFTSITTLVIRGDRADLVGGKLGSVEIQGQGNDIAAESVRALQIRGEGNSAVVDGAIGDVVVNGNDNVVTAGDGIRSVIDNGLLNEIS